MCTKPPPLAIIHGFCWFLRDLECANADAEETESVERDDDDDDDDDTMIETLKLA